MKASSRRTSRNQRLRKILIIGSIAVLLSLFLSRALGFAATFVFEPIVKFETMLFRIGTLMPDYFKNRHSLIAEITKLENRLTFESVSESTTARLINENTELRRLLGEGEERRIAAGVIGRPTVTPYDVLILDKGAADGVVLSAPVYIGVDKVIGIVAAVYESSSVVVLATTANTKSTVYIYGPNIYTTAIGRGGGVLQVSVPQGVPLAIGDLVVLPTFGAGVYGTISLVESVPTEPEQRGFLTLPIPLQSLRLVSVGLEPLAPLSFDAAKAVVERFRSDLLTVPVPAGVLIDVDEVASGTASTTDVQVEAAAREMPTTTP